MTRRVAARARWGISQQGVPGSGKVRGFSLVELLFCLIILAVVSMLVGDMLVMLARNLKETRERDTMIARVDSAMDALRRDVWRAKAFRPQGEFLEIDLPGGTVVWNAGPGGLSRVEEGQPTRAWVDMPRVRFPADGGGAPGTLTVAVESGTPGTAKQETIQFSSQRQLAGGGV
jgi:prepilin-type N-terminal cleavage/methylation domain-containing protein